MTFVNISAIVCSNIIAIFIISAIRTINISVISCIIAPPPQRYPGSDPGIFKYYLIWQKVCWRHDYIKNLEVGRLSWTIQGFQCTPKEYRVYISQNGILTLFSSREEVKMSSLDTCAEVVDSVSSLLNPRLFHEESMGLIASCSVNRQTENRWQAIHFLTSTVQISNRRKSIFSNFP